MGDAKGGRHHNYVLRQAGQLTGPGNGAPSVWGLPVVESEACPVGFALVGDFRRAVLFDKEQVNISVGTADQDFIFVEVDLVT